MAVHVASIPSPSFDSASYANDITTSLFRDEAKGWPGATPTRPQDLETEDHQRLGRVE
jgi:hypothetical protein